MAFYIELPGDEGGNTALPWAVIEGRLVQGGTPEAGHFSNPGRQALLFDGPAEITRHWPGMYTDAYGGYAEVDGPARMLSREQWTALVASQRTCDDCGAGPGEECAWSCSGNWK